VAQIGAIGFDFDVLLSEMRLPDTVGMVVTEAGRLMDPRIRVVLMTGSGLGGLQGNVLTLQSPLVCIEKPFGLAILECAVKKAVARASGTRASPGQGGGVQSHSTPEGAR
jgi:DNA-binding NtrC family response regulator